MFPAIRSFSRILSTLGLIVVAGLVLVSCGPSAKTPVATTASGYERAKDAFKSGQLDKALELTDKLAEATPAADSTDRARVMRAVIYAGQLKSAEALTAAYSQGVKKALNPRFQTEYRRLQNENQEVATQAALNLAQTAHQIAPDGVIAKELVLEASYPITEGPVEVKALARVQQGGWIESDQQESAAADSLRKGLDDALADLVGGDRAKARQALADGSLKLDGAAFALFLSKELADGATIFDRHHGRDPQKLIALCTEGDDTLKASLASLKETPNKDEEKEAKKLQEKFQTLRKDR